MSNSLPRSVPSAKFVRGVAICAMLLLPGSRAFAVSKEMVQLQTQVQQLQDAVARLQQSNDERMGVMKDLVQQTADSVNRMGVTVQGLQGKLGAGTEANAAKLDQVSSQVQSLNDSIDELKARLQRIEKSLADVQSTQQSMGARMDAAPASGTYAGTGTSSPFAGDTAMAVPKTSARSSRAAAPPPGFPADAATDSAASAPADAGSASAGGAPPVTDLYQTAYGDYSGAKYDLAKAEFQDVIRYYPDNGLAGNAHFYLGELLMKSRDYGPATKQYDKVIEGFPGNSKIPAAQLRKGQALLALKDTAGGVRELKSLVARYPNSPEAAQARARLADVGARR